MTPRREMREMLRRIAAASVPHLTAEQQAFWFARKISAESGKLVSAGTVTRWRNAQCDDDGTVDSRHMDWARARSRTMSANDNRAGFRAGDCLPSPPSLIAA